MHRKRKGNFEEKKKIEINILIWVFPSWPFFMPQHNMWTLKIAFVLRIANALPLVMPKTKKEGYSEEWHWSKKYINDKIFSLPESETASIIQGTSAVKVEREIYFLEMSDENSGQSMSSENYVFACDGKTFNLIRSKVNTPTSQTVIDSIHYSQSLFFNHNINSQVKR